MNLNQWLLLFLALLGLLGSRVQPASSLSGPHVCTKQQTYSEIANVSYTTATPVRTYTFCFSVPPKCSKYKIVYKTKYKQQVQTKIRTIDICCTGYKPTEDESRCQPICTGKCGPDGTCLETGYCLCEPNITGENCDSRVITTPPSNLTLVEGETANFTCGVIGVNVPPVWKKEGVPLSQLPWMDSRFSVSPDGTLTIAETSANDTGSYECQVTRGTPGDRRVASAQGYLNVEYPAHVTHSEAELFLHKNEEGVVNCYINSNPPIKFVTWLKDEVVLNARAEEGLSLLQNGSLLVTKAIERHEGNYICIPYNVHQTGGFYGKTKVTVIDQPYFDTRPQPVYHRTTGDNVTLECSGVGGPTNIVTWRKKDGSDLHEDRISFHEGNLTMTSLTRSDEGFYECTITNAIGSINAQTQIIVDDVTDAPEDYVTDASVDDVREPSEADRLPCSCEALQDSWRDCSGASSSPSPVVRQILECVLEKCLASAEDPTLLKVADETHTKSTGQSISEDVTSPSPIHIPFFLNW